MMSLIRKIFNIKTYWYYVSNNGIKIANGVFSANDKYFPIGTMDNEILWNKNRQPNEPKYLITYATRISKNEFKKCYNSYD